MKSKEDRQKTNSNSGRSFDRNAKKGVRKRERKSTTKTYSTRLNHEYIEFIQEISYLTGAPQRVVIQDALDYMYKDSEGKLKDEYIDKE